jgi:2-polyprenyl-3-methyl-5-hydroxy-6-metoxy-1,4-benzoquinol methylase
VTDFIKTIRGLRDRLSFTAHAPVAARPAIYRSDPPKLAIACISNQEDFLKHLKDILVLDPDRRKHESELAQPTANFRTPGFCFVCRRWTEFVSSWDYSYEVADHRHVNWREHLLCPGCKLNNRMRAVIHLLAESISLSRDSRIYATEQTSPLFDYLRKSFPFIVGSEYLGAAVPFGQKNAIGLRNEDLTRLTFPDESFDAILSFEVLEHIPNYFAAFKECVRTLRPRGKMLFSVPFDVKARQNLIRARLRADGTIEDLLPPEYHSDPRDSGGSLCFQHFGWEMFEQLKVAGFSTVSTLCYYSRDFGYLGGEQVQFLAEK